MTELGPRFEEAAVFATRLHSGQKRKTTGAPYLSHLLGVTSIALDHGADEDEAIAALLHDAIEDQGGANTREEIRKRFGDRVTSIVDGCTDTDVMPKPPWRERKENYISHARTAPPPVVLISAADKLYNVRALMDGYRNHGEDLWSHFKGGRDGTLWYYRALVDAFRQALSSHSDVPAATVRLVDEYALAVEELLNMTEGQGPSPASG